MNPIVLISNACQNLNFSDFSVIGKCVVEFGLFGDITLAGLMVFVVFAGFIMRYNMPGNLLLPLGAALTYGLYIISPQPQFLFLFILTLIINGVLIVMGILNYVNR